MKTLSINKVGAILKVESKDFVYERVGNINNITFREGLDKCTIANIKDWIYDLESIINNV